MEASPWQTEYTDIERSTKKTGFIIYLLADGIESSLPQSDLNQKQLFIMDFSTAINEYKKSTCTQSPIWIWFDKESNGGRCLICNNVVSRKDSSTSNLIFHLKQTHGCLKKYNAYREYEELNQLKEGQKKKRKQSVCDDANEPPA